MRGSAPQWRTCARCKLEANLTRMQHMLMRVCARQTEQEFGRERTRVEWEALLSGARFKLRSIVRTRGPLCVVEAVPV
jgi:hypothetical protein